MKLKAIGGVAVVISMCAGLPCRAQVADVPEGPLPSRAFEPTALALDDQPRGDGRRTLGAFPRNLGRNFVGVFSGQNLVPFAVGLAATAGATALDDNAQRAMQGACTVCGSTGATVGGADLAIATGVAFAAGRFAPQGRFRSMTYDFAQAMAVNGVYTGVIKAAAGRQRPDGSNSQSFPSGHTSSTFALAAVASHHYGWRVGLPAYALAAGVGLSRVESDKHYLSDVVAGATLGFVVGRTVARLDGQPAGKKRLVSVAPVSGPGGHGVGLGFSASW